MQIKRIELVLENCEVINVDAKYIGEMFIGDTSWDVSHMGKSYYCNIFCIEIHKDFDKYGVVQSYSPYDVPNVFNQ